MPTNRNQYQRLGIIHQLIVRNTRPNWRDMAEACVRDLSLPTHADSLRRTIYNDLEDLKNAPFFAPLVSKNGRYSYGAPYSLNNFINPDDVILLNEMQVLFQQFATLPQFKGLEEVQLKIAERAGGQRPILIEFEKNDNYTGNQYLWPIYEAIRDRKALKINYKDFKENLTQHTLSPALLREYRNRWFVFGWQHVEARIYNLALDRIEKIEISDFGYAPARTSIGMHLHDVVGVTNYEAAYPQQVELKLQKPRAFYLKTKPLHASQTIVRETPQTITFKYQLQLNPELESEILSYGADIEVLAPDKLRLRMQDVIAAMAKRYNDRSY